MNEVLEVISNIDPNFHVLIVTKEDESYSRLKPYFDRFGLAFLDFKTKMIAVDGEEIGKQGFPFYDLIQFMVAHEISHYYLGHKGEYGDVQEAQADILGITLCEKKGYLKSAQIGREMYQRRNGITYEEALEQFKTELAPWL